MILLLKRAFFIQRFFITFIGAAILSSIHIAAIAQDVKPDSLVGKVDNNTEVEARPAMPDSIIKFDQLDMPVEMAIEFSKLQPNEALLFRDEFQQMHDGLYGQSVRTIKIWYIDDHIIGYILEKPFDAGDNKGHKYKINIPVTWCCTPSVPGHDEHCVNNLADLRTMQAANKCTGWHLKLPDEFNLNPQPKIQYNKRDKKAPPKTGDFGHTQKTDTKTLKKSNQPGFPQNDTIPAVDTTQAKPRKDSI